MIDERETRQLDVYLVYCTNCFVVRVNDFPVDPPETVELLCGVCHEHQPHQQITPGHCGAFTTREYKS